MSPGYVTSGGWCHGWHPTGIITCSGGYSNFDHDHHQLGFQPVSKHYTGSLSKFSSVVLQQKIRVRARKLLFSLLAFALLFLLANLGLNKKKVPIHL